MGIIKRLLGRSKTAELSAVKPAGTPPQLAPAVAALQGEEWAAAVRLAQPYLEAKEPALRADAYRLCALATSRQGQWGTAFSCWLKLFELEPNAHNALQLASVSVMAGEIARGQAWMMKFDELNRQSREFSCAMAYANFASALAQAGHAAEALPYLTWLRELYRELKITDDMFLHQRGVPFFGAFLENSLPLLQTCLDDGELLAWYRAMLDDLDDAGRARLSGWLADAMPYAAANEQTE
ncbi:hypothetical protein [Chromobacterium sp. IIBBL 290-4]|uniref:hypothetical protein n=1 Tax=Chromobacterium sp. IIBBL 290-4 TaxID=2953890 RepID=UPI0020B6F77F|nr:hypothetical protein [Chromobacterium sp. IIBBL 290-4]UTH76622.1 hypothetical protein NKT35_11190 [Chromobacterium sp. IIBBL 290-4]